MNYDQEPKPKQEPEPKLKQEQIDPKDQPLSDTPEGRSSFDARRSEHVRGSSTS